MSQKIIFSERPCTLVTTCVFYVLMYELIKNVHKCFQKNPWLWFLPGNGQLVEVVSMTTTALARAYLSHILYYRKYYVFHILPQIYTENHATFPIQMYAILVYICGNFWCTQYILQITQPSQYRCTQLQYRFAVISEAPSIWLSDRKRLMYRKYHGVGTMKISLNLFWSSISMSRLCSFDLSLSTLSQPSSVMPPVIQLVLIKVCLGNSFYRSTKIQINP